MQIFCGHDNSLAHKRKIDFGRVRKNRKSFLLKLAGEAAIEIRGINGSVLQRLGQQRLVANNQKTNIILLYV